MIEITQSPKTSRLQTDLVGCECVGNESLVPNECLWVFHGERPSWSPYETQQARKHPTVVIPRMFRDKITLFEQSSSSFRPCISPCSLLSTEGVSYDVLAPIAKYCLPKRFSATSPPRERDNVELGQKLLDETAATPVAASLISKT